MRQKTIFGTSEVAYKKATKRRRKPKPKPRLSCGFCEEFYKSRRRNLKEKKRYCSIIDDYIRSTTKSCDSFVLNRYIWCDKWNAFLHKDACIDNKIKRRTGCIRCKTGKLINEIS